MDAIPEMSDLAFVHCKKCTRRLGKRVILTDYDYYHVECFRCCNCESKLSPENLYFERGGRIYCQRCIGEEAELTCYACKKSTSANESVRVFDRLCHKTCAKCEKCGVSFSDHPHYPIEDKAYFVSCHRFVSAEKQKESASSKPRPETPAICYVCKENITAPTCLQVLDRLCHHSCAKCEKCSGPFSEEQCYPIDGNACCLDCYWIIVAEKRKRERASRKPTK